MSMTKIEKNIKLLEQGITLQEYLELEDELKIDGTTDIYDKYGAYVIYNNTQKVFTVGIYGMSIDIKQFFVTYNGRGNVYMHKHYLDGDEMRVKFHRFDSDSDEAEFKLKLKNEYSLWGETYLDYIRRKINENNEEHEAIVKMIREKYSLPDSNSLAAKLLRLEHESKFLYELLNALVDILVKSFPLFAFLAWIEFGWSGGDLVAQHIVIIYLYAIYMYLVVLLFVQFVKLITCKYKRLIVKIRIFDIIIKLGSSRLYSVSDTELLNEHEKIVEERKRKISKYKAKVHDRDIKEKEWQVEILREEQKANKEKYEKNLYDAERKFKSAKEGDGLFKTAEEKRKEGSEYLKTANFYSEQAQRNMQEIERLEQTINRSKSRHNKKNDIECDHDSSSDFLNKIFKILVKVLIVLLILLILLMLYVRIVNNKYKTKANRTIVDTETEIIVDENDSPYTEVETADDYNNSDEKQNETLERVSISNYKGVDWVTTENCSQDIGNSFISGNGVEYTVAGREENSESGRVRLILVSENGDEYVINNLPAFIMDKETGIKYYNIYHYE